MADQAAWGVAVRAALAQAAGVSSWIRRTDQVGRRVRTSCSQAKGFRPWVWQDSMRLYRVAARSPASAPPMNRLDEKAEAEHSITLLPYEN